MSSKKIKLYDIEAEREGKLITYAIFKQGRRYWIDSYLVHPSNASEWGIRTELAVVFHAKFIRIM